MNKTILENGCIEYKIQEGMVPSFEEKAKFNFPGDHVSIAVEEVGGIYVKFIYVKFRMSRMSNPGEIGNCTESLITVYISKASKNVLLVYCTKVVDIKSGVSEVRSVSHSEDACRKKAVLFTEVFFDDYIRNPKAVIENSMERVAKLEKEAPGSNSVKLPPVPECGVCYENLLPPKKIMQCGAGHKVCQDCQIRLVNCPQCKGSFVGRDHFLENFLTSLYSTKT